MDDPALLIESFRQSSAIGAVLGGLAFTAAAAILAVGAGTTGAIARTAVYTAGAATASAACLILSTLTWSLLASEAVWASADGQAFDAGLLWISRTASLAFVLGLALLFVAIGASGWMGSRALGVFTSGVAALAGLITLFIVFQFVS